MASLKKWKDLVRPFAIVSLLRSSWSWAAAVPSRGSHTLPLNHWHLSLDSPVSVCTPGPEGGILWQLQPAPYSQVKPHQPTQAPEGTASVEKPPLQPTSFVCLSGLSAFRHTHSCPLIFPLPDFNSLYYLYALEAHRIEA